MKSLLIVLTLCIAACGGGGDNGRDQAAKEDIETVFDPLVSTIDKAKGVEATVLQSKDDIDKALEEADPDQ